MRKRVRFSNEKCDIVTNYSHSFSDLVNALTWLIIIIIIIIGLA